MPPKTPIAVVALNGFLGDRRNELDVGEIVNYRARLAGVPYYTRRGGGASHGGWNRREKRRVKDWIYHRLGATTPLLFVGKSYGAHWIVDFLQDAMLGAHSHALLFDPAHTLMRSSGKARTVAFPPSVTVVRQTGFRSGYSVRGAADIVVRAHHKDIESRKPAIEELEKFLNLHLGAT